jgi:hypothetical protein
MVTIWSPKEYRDIVMFSFLASPRFLVSQFWGSFIDGVFGDFFIVIEAPKVL